MDRRVTLKCWISIASVLPLWGAAFAQPVAPKQPRTIDTLPSVIPIFSLEACDPLSEGRPAIRAIGCAGVIEEFGQPARHLR